APAASAKNRRHATSVALASSEGGTFGRGGHLVREAGDRIEHPRRREHVVVTRPGGTDEPLRLRGGGEEPLAEDERDGRIAIAVRDEQGNRERPYARQGVEASAGEERDRTVVRAGDVPQRGEGGHHADPRAR